MSYRKTSRAGTIKGSASSIGSVLEENVDQPGLSAEATPVEAPPKKSQKSTATKETIKNEGKRKFVVGETKAQQIFSFLRFLWFPLSQYSFATFWEELQPE